MVRHAYAFSVIALLAACGGSSTKEGSGGSGNGASAGTSAGTGGSGGSAGTHGGASGSGGFAATPGVGGNDGGTSLGASGGTAGDANGGSAGVVFGGGTGALGGSGGVSGTSTDACGPNCAIGGSSVTTPLDPPGPIRCGGVQCKSNEDCCLATSTCYDAAKRPDVCPVPPNDGDQWDRLPCASNAQCAPGWFCTIDNGLCQGTGHCQPIDNCGGCGDDGSGRCRICGCDGNTYPDVQTACLSRAFGPTSGAGCGEDIIVGGGGASAAGAGGTGGSTSPPVVITPCGTNDDCKRSGELCCAITGRCYPKSEPGQCTTPPDGTRFPCTSSDQCYSSEICAGEGCDAAGGCIPRSGEDCGVLFSPVCGCDGQSYTSADCANQRGVRVASDGACTTK